MEGTQRVVSTRGKSDEEALKLHWEAAAKKFSYLVVPVTDKKYSKRSIGGSKKVWEKAETADWVYDLVNYLVGPEREVARARDVLVSEGVKLEPVYIVTQNNIDQYSDPVEQIITKYKASKVTAHLNADDLLLFAVGRKEEKITYESVKSEKKAATAGAKTGPGGRSAVLKYSSLPTSANADGKFSYLDVTKLTDAGVGARIVHHNPSSNLRGGKRIIDKLIYSDVSQIRTFGKFAKMTDADIKQLVDRAQQQAIVPKAAQVPAVPTNLRANSAVRVPSPVRVSSPVRVNSSGRSPSPIRISSPTQKINLPVPRTTAPTVSR